MTILRDATAKVQKRSGDINRPGFDTETSFPVYWETTSQIVTGADGNELKSIAYGDFPLSAGVSIGDKINSVIENSVELLTTPATIKAVGVYTMFDRIEVFI